jgi:hypothetical protein
MVAGARNHLNLLFDAPELRRWARDAAIQASGIFAGALEAQSFATWQTCRRRTSRPNGNGLPASAG